MRRFVDLDTLEVQERRGYRLPREVWKASLGRVELLEVKFHRAGVLELLPDGATLLAAFKVAGVFDATTFLASETTWTTPDDTDGYYSCLIDFNTDEANTALANNDDETDDIESIVLDASISWSDSAEGTPGKSNNFYVELWNTVIRSGDEASSGGSGGGGSSAIFPSLTGTGGLEEETGTALIVYWALHSDSEVYAYRFVSGAGTTSLPDRVRNTADTGYFKRIV